MQFLTFTNIIVACLILAQNSVAYIDMACSEPRVRKEWRNLSDVQKKAYIDAVKCLTKLPHGSDLTATGVTSNVSSINSNSSRYDDLVYVHGDTYIRNHFTGAFLPWHRWYLRRFEQELQTKCGYEHALPFWDWSKDASAGLLNSSIFNSSSIYGLGTFGVNSENYTVANGAFANTAVAYPSPHNIQRNYTRYPYRAQPPPFNASNPDISAESTFTPDKVRAVAESKPGNYTAVVLLMNGKNRQGMHSGVHLGIGGDMRDRLWSPNDLIFWLHHANIDCIWARWQARHPLSLYAIGGGATQDLNHYDRYPVGAPPAVTLQTELLTGGLSPPIAVRDVMYTGNKQLCYRCSY